MGYIGAGPTRFNTADELTVTGNAEFNGNLTVKGTTTTIDSVTVQNFDMGDNDRIRIGDSQDLQIYHNGSNSYIQEISTGNLFIASDANVNITNQVTSELKATFISNGAVNLYYDNAKKLATTATGVDVTGDVTADGLTVANSVASDDLVYFNNTNANQSDVLRLNTAGLGSGTNILDVQSGGSTHFMVRGDGNVGIGTSSPTKTLDINTASATFRIRNASAGNDFAFKTTAGPVSVIGCEANTSLALMTNNAERMRIDTSGNVGIGTSVTGDAELVVYGADAATIYKNTNTGTGTGDGFFVGLAKGNGTDAYVYQRENTNMIFGTNNAERLRIDGSGSVGIGTAPSGGVQLDVRGTGVLQLVNTDTVQLLASSGGSTLKNVSNNPLIFGTNNTERMRINSFGDVCIGSSAISSNRLRLDKDNATAYFNAQLELYSDAGNIMQSFHAGGSSVVTLKHVRGVDGIEVRDLNGTTYKDIRASAFTVNSDYRLKENIVPLENATERLKQIPVHRFNFKSIEKTGEGFGDATVDGFLAHEIAEHVPEAVFGTKDEMREEDYIVSAATGDIYTPAVEATYDEDGAELTAAVDEVIHSADVERPIELAEDQYWRETTAEVTGTRTVPKYQSLDQAKLVPLLVKTIQELEARIAALETA